MRFRLLFTLISSAIGILLGLLAHIAFFYVIKNEAAGTWALISGIFAAVCFHINWLYLKDRLDYYHTPQTIDKVQTMGFIVCLISTACMIWYIFSAVYYKTEAVPIEKTSAVTAVWAFMTAKWGLAIMISSLHYKKILREVHPTLLSP